MRTGLRGAACVLVAAAAALGGSLATAAPAAAHPLGNFTVSHYDGLLLPGGVVNPDTLRQDEDALAFVKAFFDAGKPVAAICHAPWTLLEAGVLEGRTLTSFPSIRGDLRRGGATVVDEEVASFFF